MKKFLGMWLICCPLLVQAQFTYEFDQTIRVLDTDQNEHLLPWAGGLNAAQYNTLDLNGDGFNDLVLFDRMANKVITFLNIGSQYKYAPEYEQLFPPLTNWLLIRDFNCDGKKDIFTGHPLGIQVYKNISESGGNLEWEPFEFFTQAGQPKSPVLLTKGFLGLINLQLQFDDLPTFVDVDGDGDLDILNMRFVGESSVEFHKNYSMERYGTCDSLEFERITQTWGDFKECECGSFAFNGEDCPPNSGGRIKHAGGKALLAIDIDNDQDLDLLFSEAECTQLFLLENQGSNETPVFSSAVNFPASNPSDFLIFPAAFYEDVDFDGVNDLIVTPNIFNKEFLNIDLQQSNWFYKNNGSTELPNLNFMKKNFLQDQMIDVGDNAVPAFFDLDGDGDLDMVVGQNNQADVLNGSLYLFENTGSATEPAFQLVTTNYLNLQSQFLYNIKPQFYDVNGDGKTDLIFTATRFTTGQTRLFTVLNKASTGVDFNGQEINQVNFNMLFSENVHITDVDRDGLPDILIGKSNGSVQFWKNNGPKGSLNFSLAEATFLGLGSSIERQSLALHTNDLNADGKADLIIGDQYGNIGIINNYREVSGEATILRNLIFNPLLNVYNSPNLGGRVWPTTANLFNTNQSAIVAGNILGGIQILRHDESTPLTEELKVEIFPNPVEQSAVLHIKTDRAAAAQFITILGQVLTEPVVLQANLEYEISLPKLARGVYLIRFFTQNKTVAKRIVVY